MITVPIGSTDFSPALTMVPIGTTVTWSWDSGYYGSGHSVNFDDGAPGVDSTVTANFQRTFTVAGVYTYQCTVHPGMGGAVVVK